MELLTKRITSLKISAFRLLQPNTKEGYGPMVDKFDVYSL